MRKDNDLDSLFHKLDGAFDQELPRDGHEQRFEVKLKELSKKGPPTLDLSKFRSWNPMAIAASLLLLVSISGLTWTAVRPETNSLTAYAPEISATSDYFGNLISQRVILLRSENSEQIKPVVEAAIAQLKDLESDYHVLEKEVLAGGNTELILKAMLRNFQTRLALIESVLKQIEHLKEIQNDEQIL